MDNSLTNTITAAVILIIIAVFIYIMYKKYGQGQVVEVTEELRDDSDPIQKYKNECHNALIGRIMMEVGAMWNIGPNDEGISYNPVDFDTLLINILHENMALDILCMWNRGKIKVMFNSDEPSCVYHKSKTFRVNAGMINIGKFSDFINDCYWKVYKSVMPREDKQTEEIFKNAMNLAADEHLTDAMAVKALLDLLDTFPIRRSRKYYHNDILTFTRYLTYVLRFHKDEFIKYIHNKANEEKSADQKDTE